MTTPMTDLRAALAEVLELERKATPGPWRSLRDGNQYLKTEYLPTAECVGASRVEGPKRPWNPHALVSFGFRPKEYETVRFTDEDADLVSALRNLLHAHGEELAAALRDAERYRWLRQFAGNVEAFPGGMKNPESPGEMDAQIDAALAAKETK